MKTGGSLCRIRTSIGFTLTEVLAAVLIWSGLLVGIAHLSVRIEQDTRRGQRLLRQWQDALDDPSAPDVCRSRPFDTPRWRYRTDPVPAVWPRTEDIGPLTCR